jgi:hypothetical protein
MSSIFERENGYTAWLRVEVGFPVCVGFSFFSASSRLALGAHLILKKALSSYVNRQGREIHQVTN